MRILFAVLLLGLFAACEKRPTPAELETQRQAEAARSSPRPKPGDWMWKDHKTELDPPKKR